MGYLDKLPEQYLLLRLPLLSQDTALCPMLDPLTDLHYGILHLKTLAMK